MDSQPENNIIGAEDISSILTTNSLGKVFMYHDTVNSTNEEAASWAQEGTPHGAVVVCGIQKAGYGRLNREYCHSGQGID